MRRVGSLGPGLTSDSADAASGCLAKRSVGRVPGFGTHRRCRSDLPGLDQRPGFHRSDGQRVRAIPQPEKGMAVTIVETRAEIRAITGGVDTHADVHVAAALDPIGGLLGVEEFPATRRLRPPARLAGRVRDGLPGRDRRDRQLRRRTVPARHRGRHPGRRGRPLRPPGPPPAGQSDPLDAVSAARAAQSGRARGAPKGRDGAVEAIRALMVARRGAVENAPGRSTRPGRWS